MIIAKEEIDAIGGGLIADLLAERRRLADQEGFTPEQVDALSFDQLARAGGCYALYGSWPSFVPSIPPSQWPLQSGQWKPADRRATLVMAMAMIMINIESIDRQAGQDAKPRVCTWRKDQRIDGFFDTACGRWSPIPIDSGVCPYCNSPAAMEQTNDTKNKEHSNV